MSWRLSKSSEFRGSLEIAWPMSVAQQGPVDCGGFKVPSESGSTQGLGSGFSASESTDIKTVVLYAYVCLASQSDRMRVRSKQHNVMFVHNSADRI